MDINVALLVYTVLFCITAGPSGLFVLVLVFRIWRNEARKDANLIKLVELLKEEDETMQNFISYEYEKHLREEMNK